MVLEIKTSYSKIWNPLVIFHEFPFRPLKTPPEPRAREVHKRKLKTTVGSRFSLQQHTTQGDVLVEAATPSIKTTLQVLT